MAGKKIWSNWIAILGLAAVLAACAGVGYLLPQPPATETVSSQLPLQSQPVLASASPLPPAEATVGPRLETAAPVETALERPTLTPTAAVVDANGPLHPKYFLEAELDYPAHRLAVREVVTFTNFTGQVLNTLVFGVDAQRTDKVFALEELATAGLVTATVTLSDGVMIVGLEPPLQPGEEMAIFMRFSLSLSEENSGATGYTQRQANFGDWYPYLAFYAPGEGWVMHAPGQVGETQLYPNGDYIVRLKIGDPDLVVAASLPTHEEQGWLQMQARGVRNVAWSVSPDYLLFETESDGVSLRQYVFPEHAQAGKAALETASQAFALYRQVFGSPGIEQLSMVEAEFFDGMEYDGLFFLSADYFGAYSGNPMGYLTMLTAHEVSHQWWYGSVANDQALEPWLDEALCTYSEHIYYQHYYAYLDDWWWTFRVDRYAPDGWVDSTVYDHSSFRAYVNAVYLRGALYMRELGQIMGEERLQSFLQVYHSLFAEKTVKKGDFDDLLRAYLSDEEIRVVSEKYFKTAP